MIVRLEREVDSEEEFELMRDKNQLPGDVWLLFDNSGIDSGFIENFGVIRSVNRCGVLSEIEYRISDGVHTALWNLLDECHIDKREVFHLGERVKE